MTHRSSALFCSQTDRFEPWVWVIFMIGLGGAWSPSVHAQIIPDETLGHESSIVTPEHLRGLESSRIDGGAIRANVLFHSFKDFNVTAGQGAYFSNPSGISNIFSRVTGDTPSDIMGRLGVLGDANLFMLNPNGIVFGPNSSLDVSGSFIASTADQFSFGDGQSFSAIAPDSAPLLSINVPVGLQYGSGTAGAIINAGNLEVGSGHALTLTGSSVVHTGSLTAPGGEVAIASIANPGTSTRPTTTNLQLGHNGQLLAIETRTNNGSIASGSFRPATASALDLLSDHSEDLGLSIGPTGQVVTTHGTHIPLDMATEPGHSMITGTIDAATTVPGHIGGQATALGDRVTLIDHAQVDVSGHRGGGIAHLGGGYQGNGIGLNAETTIVGSNVVIEANAIASGPGGEAIVWADGSTQFYGSASAQGGVRGGDGGLVEVSGKQSLLFAGQADLSAPQGLPGTLLLDPTNITIADSSGGANDGDISDADGTILSSDGAGDNFTISEDTLEDLAEDTNIELQATNNIIIANLTTDGELAFREVSTDGASSVTFTADADGDGVGNFVMQNRENSILTRGRNIAISGATISPGIINSEGGNIQLTASDSINLSDGVSLHSGDFEGNAFTDFSGDISLTATNNITVKRASITATGNGDNDGGIQDSGSIDLETTNGSIRLIRAQLSSETLGQGLAGDIELEAGDRLIIRSGSTLTSGAENGFTETGVAAGAGNIELRALDNIQIRNSKIMAESAGGSETDDQGEITLTSSNGSIRLLQGSALSTQAEISGFAGPIMLSADNGSLRLQNSLISSDLEGTFEADGGAGEIELSSQNAIRLRGSQISASSFSTDTTEDTSGSISLRSTDGGIVLRNSRVATTTTSTGTAGEISLNAPQGRIELIGNGDTDREGVFTEADQGFAGDLDITTNQLLVEQGAQVSARTKTGSAGDISINQPESNDSVNPVELLIVRGDSSRITARARRNGGQAGFITIDARTLLIEDNGLIEASSISSQAIDSIVRLQNVETLALTGGGQINVETARGQAGNVEINRNSLPVNQLQLDGDLSRISARATARGGVSGKVEIHAQNIQIENGARITAANRRNTSSNNPLFLSELLLEDVTSLQVLSGGQLSVRTRTGTAGDVEINQNGSQPLETLIVDGIGSRITARAIGNGGEAGQVAMNGRNVTVSDRAQITAANISSSDTTTIDNIVLEQVDTLEVLSGGEISVRTRSGTAGNVELNQGGSQPITLLVVDGNDSRITARALRSGGVAGRVAINAQTILVDNMGQITAANVDGFGTTLDTDSSLAFTNVETLEVLNGGQISVLTQRGSAGNIEIDTGTLTSSSSIRVEGQGSEITAQATNANTTPRAGNITINTNNLNVSDGGSITVSSPGVAGNLELTVPFIVLDNGQLRAEIGSQTQSDTGAEISLSSLRSLLMRNNSLISASATNGATGGNLTFGDRDNPVGFVGAPSNSNSDIIATAQQGQGGNITLTVAQIEGFTVRNTPFVRNNRTNDISASSSGGPQGNIVLETPSVNPLGSLTALPGLLLELPPIASLCRPQEQGRSEFTQVGRGGLPRHPEDVLGPGSATVPWVNRGETASPLLQDHGQALTHDTNPTTFEPRPQSSTAHHSILEVQGWTTDPQGNLVLTAHLPTNVTPDSSGAIASPSCTP